MAELTRIISFRVVSKELFVVTNEGSFSHRFNDAPKDIIAQANVSQILCDGHIMMMTFAKGNDKAGPITLERIIDHSQEAGAMVEEKLELKAFQIEGAYLSVKTNQGFFSTKLSPQWRSHAKETSITSMLIKDGKLNVKFQFDDDDVVSTFCLKLERQKEIVPLTPKQKVTLIHSGYRMRVSGDKNEFCKFAGEYSICGVKDFSDALDRYDTLCGYIDASKRPRLSRQLSILRRFRETFDLDYAMGKTSSAQSRGYDYSGFPRRSIIELDKNLRSQTNHFGLCVDLSHASFHGWDMTNEDPSMYTFSKTDTFRIYSVDKIKVDANQAEEITIGTIYYMTRDDACYVRFEVDDSGNDVVKNEQVQWILHYTIVRK